jgi:hypothetical protein
MPGTHGKMVFRILHGGPERFSIAACPMLSIGAQPGPTTNTRNDAKPSGATLHHRCQTAANC